MVNSNLKPPMATKAYPLASHAPPLFHEAGSLSLPALVRAKVDKEKRYEISYRTPYCWYVGTECTKYGGTVRGCCSTVFVLYCVCHAMPCFYHTILYYTILYHTHIQCSRIPLCRCRRRRMYVNRPICKQAASCTPRTLALTYCT